MAFSPSRTYRLRSAYFLLAVLSPFVFGYTPPATPDLPLNYEFLGSNAESESLAFYNTQCDSNNFSWRGIDWFCAVGDPTNQVCYVKMAYHATDVNNCQDSSIDPDNPDPEEPDPNDPTLVVKPFPDIPIPDSIAHIFAALDSIYSASTNNIRQSKATTDAVYYVGDQNASNSRMIADKIDFQGQATSGVMREMVNAINYNTDWTSQSQIILAESNNLLKSIESKTGSSSVKDYSSVLNYIANSVGELSSLPAIVNNTSSIPAITNILSGSILDYLGQIANASGSGSGGNTQLEMQKLEMMMQQYLQLEKINSSLDTIKSDSGVSDNSAILEHFEQANNQLSDIVLRMRDIENAIGKSEKGIVDAIEKGLGDGSQNDSISENGCVSFQCTSNTPACYIARKEWEKSCSAIAENNSYNDGIDSLTNQLSDFVNHPDSDIKNLDAGTVDIKQFTNHYNSSNGVNFGGSDTCPPPYVIDAKITTFTLDLTPFCDLATVIKFFLIAFASVASGLMIVKYH